MGMVATIIEVMGDIIVAIESMTMVLPGEPKNIALEVARQTSTWCHREHGKEITYQLVDKQAFADKSNMPSRVRQSLGVIDGECFLLIEIMPEESWTSDEARDFLSMVNQYAFGVASSIMGLGGDDDGEEWKRACDQDDEE